MNVRPALVAALFACAMSICPSARAAAPEQVADRAADAEAAVAAPIVPDAASIDRMTAHIMTMMPMDRIFETVLASNQAEMKSELNATQLACVTRELGRDALTARKRAEVERFARAKPEAFVSGLKVLEDGAAEMIAMTVEASIAGKELDMNQAEGEAMIAFVTFAFDDQLADLRALSGFGGMNDPEGSNGSTEAMMDALAADLSKTCEIPIEMLD